MVLSPIITGEDCTGDTKDYSSLDINREILKEIAKLYKISTTASYPISSSLNKKRVLRRTSLTSSKNADGELPCLASIGQLVHHPVCLGHQKATVMVIGNISAGKSTFINWLVKEAVQKTGMAIETSGFTYITSGRCVTEIGGDSTLALRPQLQPIVQKYRGFLENLSLKTCPSANGRLQFIDLIDTPGLADGELQYPFNVEEVILEMKNCVDLFLVFFDPIGQALGRRVLSVVKQLTDTCPDKVRFCLTKVDQIRTEEERIKVMCQTTQSLTTKINSRHGFDLIPIYIPGAGDGTYLSLHNRNIQQEPPIVNRVHDLVSEIERVTERRVQDVLNGLHTDVTTLSNKVDRLLEKHKDNRNKIELYYASSRRRSIFRIFIFLFAVVIALVQLHSRKDILKLFGLNYNLFYLLGKDVPSILDYVSAILNTMGDSIYILLWSIIFLLWCSTLRFRGAPCVSLSHQDDFAQLLESKDFLKAAKLRWKQLNCVYLNHAMADPPSDSQSNIET